MDTASPDSTASKTETVVHYRFMPSIAGVTMELWEPVRHAQQNSAPYQFRWQHQYASEREALAALQQYLLVNSITTAIAAQVSDSNVAASATVVTLGHP